MYVMNRETVSNIIFKELEAVTDFTAEESREQQLKYVKILSNQIADKILKEGTQPNKEVKESVPVIVKSGNGKRPYKLFLSLLPRNIRKPEINNMEITVVPSFKNKKSTSHEVYCKFKEKFEDIKTLGDLYTTIKQCLIEHTGKSVTMTETAFVWGMISQETKDMFFKLCS